VPEADETGADRGWRGRNFVALASILMALGGALTWAIILLGQSDQASTSIREEPQSDQPVSREEVSRILFASKQEGGVFELHGINHDGTDEVVLFSERVDVRTPAWSPDRQRIAFVRVEAIPHSDQVEQDLFVMNADGSEVVRLTSGPGAKDDPSWSPNGVRLAFTHRDAGSGRSHIAVTTIAGGEPVALSLPPEGCSDREPAWSPDSATLAFSRKCGREASSLYLMDADGSAPSLLTTFGRSPAWSPDGSRLAYTGQGRAGPAVFLIDVHGKEKVLLTRDFSGDPAWSPDGTRIAFTRNDLAGLSLYIINVDGTGITRLTDNASNQVTPSW
jgi:Tol biopolymer transport system component